MIKPRCSNCRLITANFSDVRIVWIFTVDIEMGPLFVVSSEDGQCNR